MDNVLAVREEQCNVMKSVLQFINKYDKQTSILKGGTALMFGYHLDRFSEDIDLDSTNRNLGKIINEFCNIHSYGFSIKKDTQTVKRYMIEFKPGKKIKVEISYRNKELSSQDYEIFDGIKIYKIENLFGMKLNAYNNRDKIRDLYDIVFIANNYRDQLSNFAVNMLKTALSFKGLEQFDYLIQTQEDELIDKEKLGNDFLQLFDDMGLIDDQTDLDLEDEDDLELV